MTHNIIGTIVVITGASSGLGEAAARLLSAEGATVVLGARLTTWMKVALPPPPNTAEPLSVAPTLWLPAHNSEV